MGASVVQITRGGAAQILHSTSLGHNFRIYIYNFLLIRALGMAIKMQIRYRLRHLFTTWRRREKRRYTQKSPCQLHPDVALCNVANLSTAVNPTVVDNGDNVRGH